VIHSKYRTRVNRYSQTPSLLPSKGGLGGNV